MVKTLNTRSAREARLDASIEEELKARNANNEGAPQDGENIEDKNQENSSALSGWEKRYSDLRSYSQKKENDLTNKIRTLEGQLKSATEKQIKFPKTETEVKEWVEKYPDVAAIVETIAMQKVASVREEVAEQRMQNEQRAYQNEFEKNVNRILKDHPDFFAIREDTKFVDWIEKQPKYIKTVFYDEIAFEDLEDAANTTMLALEMYKAKHAPKKDDHKQDQRDAARNVIRPSHSAPVETNPSLIYESQVDKMSIREYEKREEEIMKAMREGRFVYDLSGAAR